MVWVRSWSPLVPISRALSYLKCLPAQGADCRDWWLQIRWYIWLKGHLSGVFSMYILSVVVTEHLQLGTWRRIDEQRRSQTIAVEAVIGRGSVMHLSNSTANRVSRHLSVWLVHFFQSQATVEVSTRLLQSILAGLCHKSFLPSKVTWTYGGLVYWSCRAAS